MLYLRQLISQEANENTPQINKLYDDPNYHIMNYSWKKHYSNTIYTGNSPTLTFIRENRERERSGLLKLNLDEKILLTYNQNETESERIKTVAFWDYFS